MLVWDATCPDTFAPSHLQFADMEAGAVADLAERRKRVKYTELATDHYFIPVAIKNTGVFGPEAFGFFQDIGHHIREESGESCTLLPLPHSMNHSYSKKREHSRRDGHLLPKNL